jgi:hypothetical protein
MQAMGIASCARAQHEESLWATWLDDVSLVIHSPCRLLRRMLLGGQRR